MSNHQLYVDGFFVCAVQRVYTSIMLLHTYIKVEVEGMTPADIATWPVIVRMLLALLLGGLIGLEREKRNQAAGLRTHMLVSLGASLVMLISVYGFPDLSSSSQAQVDVARIAAQVVSGVGFLGAGTIIRNGMSVKGLTTAASLWVSAAIGLACGSGFYSVALGGCGLALVALWVLNKYDIKNRVAHRIHSVVIEVEKKEGLLDQLTVEAEQCNLTVRSVRMRHIRGVDRAVADEEEVESLAPVKLVRVELKLLVVHSDELTKYCSDLMEQDGIVEVRIMD